MIFNIASPVQMQQFLFEFLELKPTKGKNDKGNYSVAEDVLLHYAEKENVEFCKLLINARKLKKAKNTYVKGFRRLIANESDIFFHTDFWLHSTRTYRSSATLFQCLKGGVLVLTNKGNIAIEEIVKRYENNEQFEVLTHDGSWKKIIGVYRNGIKKVFAVSSESGNMVTSTENHPYLTKRGWVRTDQLLKGDICYEFRSQNKELYKPNLLQLGSNEKQMQQQNKQRLSTIRGKRNKSLHKMAPFLIFSKRYGRKTRKGLVNRTNKCKWQLFTKELLLGNPKNASRQSKSKKTFNLFRKNTIIGRLGKRVWHINREISLPSINWFINEGSINENVSANLQAFEEKEIVSIIPAGECETFDLTIEDSHSFVANNIVVHNTIPKHGDIINGVPWHNIRKIFTRIEFYKQYQCGNYQLNLQEGMLGEVDYVGAEVKVAAAISEDDQLIEDLNNGYDQHSHWAGVIFGINKSVDEIKATHKDERFLAKNNFTFANLFGASSISMAEEFRKSDFYVEYVKKAFQKAKQVKGFDKSWSDFFKDYSEQHITECQKVFYKRYSGVEEWQKWIVDSYYDLGYVENPLGFRRRYPMKRNEIINFPIQSTSFHLLLHSLIETENKMRELDLRSKVVGQIHDSGYFNIFKNEAEQVMDLVEGCMTIKPMFKWLGKVKLEAEWELSDSNWLDLKLENKLFEARHIPSEEVFKEKFLHGFTEVMGMDTGLIAKILAGKKDKEDKPYQLKDWEFKYV